MNLFKEIVYDKIQSPKPMLDIWDAIQIGGFNKNQLRYFQMHKVSVGETWVSLSKYYYNDERLWWVIPLFNDVFDPFIIFDDEIKSSEIEMLQVLRNEYINELLLLARQQKINNNPNKIDKFEG
jgi:hypothetical protein